MSRIECQNIINNGRRSKSNTLRSYKITIPTANCERVIFWKTTLVEEDAYKLIKQIVFHILNIDDETNDDVSRFTVNVFFRTEDTFPKSVKEGFFEHEILGLFE
jgi:hypothetical protein